VESGIGAGVIVVAIMAALGLLVVGAIVMVVLTQVRKNKKPPQ